MKSACIPILCCLTLISCKEAQDRKDVGSPVDPQRIEDVSVTVGRLPPGWVVVADPTLAEGHNATYAYVRTIGAGKVLMETILHVDVYADTASPHFFCHKTQYEVFGPDGDVPVQVGDGGEYCLVHLREDGVVDFRGRTDAFFTGDGRVVHVMASWPRHEHTYRHDEYRTIVRSLVLSD